MTPIEKFIDSIGSADLKIVASHWCAAKAMQTMPSWSQLRPVALAKQLSDMGQAMRSMPVDLFRSGDHYVLRCDLPGADPGSVDVGVDGRTLTIRAQRSAQPEDVEWLAQERPTGTFVRQLTLGRGLDLDRIEATYADGVLSLSLPVAEEAKPRRIPIAVGGSSEQPTLEAPGAPSAT